MALGGVSNRLVFQQGQIWRLFTAPWLHGNLAHLIGNSVVLVIVGMRLERLVRAPWFLAIYLASGVGGSLFSAVLNPGGPVSVGASGAIMGLLGASLVLSFHAAAKGRRARLRWVSLRLLIPALLPTSRAWWTIAAISAALLPAPCWACSSSRCGQTRRQSPPTSARRGWSPPPSPP